MKEINDTYGHEAGDKALMHVASLMLNNVRDTDVVARLGGDEFGLLLSQTSQETGHSKAELLMQLIADTPLMIGDDAISLQIAFGTYTFGGDANVEDALHKADQDMYQRKRAMKDKDKAR